MTNEQILKKAIEKAKKNRWDGWNDWFVENWFEEWWKDTFHQEGNFKRYYAIIFSHDFAKAFWGEETIGIDDISQIPTWQYHLQQMVLEKEPLKYIEKFL